MRNILNYPQQKTAKAMKKIWIHKRSPDSKTAADAKFLKIGLSTAEQENPNFERDPVKAIEDLSSKT